MIRPDASPRVSVLINNYNYGRYLAECIESVLAQTYASVETIVYDDGSADDSFAILESYRDRVRIIAEPNFGALPAFNQANAIARAFAASSGEWIALLDSDDAFRPDKLERVVQAVCARPDAVLVQHPFAEIDAESRSTGRLRPYLKDVDIERYVYATHNLTGLFSQTSGLVFRRDYLAAMLPIPPDRFELIWPDVRLTRPSFFHGAVLTIHEPLGFYRVHGCNDSHKLLDPAYRARAIGQIYDFYNEVAARHGKPPVDIRRSILRPGQSWLAKSWRLLFGNEPLRIKAHHVAEEAANLVASVRSRLPG